MSPYNYVANNPIRFIDPDGMDYQNGIYENGLYGNTVAYLADDNNNKPVPSVEVSVAATPLENQHLSVTQTITTTTITPTNNGQIVTQVIQTITDIISNSETEPVKPGNVTTTTTITTTVNGESTTVQGPTTTEDRSKVNITALTRIDNHLENFKISHHNQFNKVNSDYWSKAISSSATGAMAPLQLFNITLKALPETIGMFLDIFGKPATAMGSMYEDMEGATEHFTDGKPINLFNSRNGYVGYDHFGVIKKIEYP